MILIDMIAWLILGFLTLGVAGLHFAMMTWKSRKPWAFEVDKNYLPKLSLIVPTFNESSVIEFKLMNIEKFDYPSSLIQVIVVDSNSTDRTLDVAKDFAKRHPSVDIECITSVEKGKTAALNVALKRVKGDVILVSDADCFYAESMLKKAIPYLSPDGIGAISGVKLILNRALSNSVKAEENYLASMNRVKLGESKFDFTPLFEGGFSAYKVGAIDAFDPYKTGSDDCGTIVKLAEAGQKAILVSEATFFTGFPVSRRERLKMKIRRSIQLIRVFVCYLRLLLQRRIKVGHRVIVSDTFIYLFSPWFFVAFLCLTPVTFWFQPWLLLLLFVFLVPKVGSMLFELFQNYLILFVGLISVAFGRTAIVWSKPKDRGPLNKQLLVDLGMI